MRIEATKQWARATRVIHGKRFERGRRRRSLTSVLLVCLQAPVRTNQRSARTSSRRLASGEPSFSAV